MVHSLWLEMAPYNQTTASAGALDDDERLVARPFEGLDADQMTERAKDFIRETGIKPNEFPNLRRGAILAGSPTSYRLRGSSDENTDLLFEGNQFSDIDKEGYVLVNEKEAAALELEQTGIQWHTFYQRLKAYPPTVYLVIICCSLGAIVQGFDESAVNGGIYFSFVDLLSIWTAC